MIEKKFKNYTFLFHIFGSYVTTSKKININKYVNIVTLLS